MNEAFFPYRFDMRYALLWLPLAVRPGRDGVTVDDSIFRATFGLLRLETHRGNVLGGHITEGYRWWTAIGARQSLADDGLAFGTSTERGVCVHFEEKVPRVIGFRPHSALTVTVADCEALVATIGHSEPRG